MKITILGKSKSAKMLAREIGCGLNEDDATVAIRYGSTRDSSAMLVINSAEAVRLSSHKANAIARLRENGLPVPNFSRDPGDLAYPILCRKFYHTRGNDVLLATGPEDTPTLQQCDYYLEFLTKESEYRLHVINNRVVSSSVKADGNRDAICWNYKTGWRFKLIKSDDPVLASLKKLAIKSVASLGLDFGAVDIIIAGGSPYVLEVNTAPGLIERRAEIYARKIGELIDERMGGESDD